jgi:ATP-binding cassette subfamily B protein
MAKVALARAYTKDAQVLIFDCLTAALDARAEYEVFQRFAELTQRKICSFDFTFFHRPSCRSNFSIRKWNAFRIWYAPRSIKADGRYAELLIYKQVINNKIIFLKNL